jgi:hypothetical protein
MRTGFPVGERIDGIGKLPVSAIVVVIRVVASSARLMQVWLSSRLALSLGSLIGLPRPLPRRHPADSGASPIATAAHRNRGARERPFLERQKR